MSDDHVSNLLQIYFQGGDFRKSDIRSYIYKNLESTTENWKANEWRKAEVKNEKIEKVAGTEFSVEDRGRNKKQI